MSLNMLLITETTQGTNMQTNDIVFAQYSDRLHGWCVWRGIVGSPTSLLVAGPFSLREDAERFLGPALPIGLPSPNVPVHLRRRRQVQRPVGLGGHNEQAARMHDLFFNFETTQGRSPFFLLRRALLCYLLSVSFNYFTDSGTQLELILSVLLAYIATLYFLMIVEAEK